MLISEKYNLRKIESNGKLIIHVNKRVREKKYLNSFDSNHIPKIKKSKLDREKRPKKLARNSKIKIIQRT